MPTSKLNNSVLVGSVIKSSISSLDTSTNDTEVETIDYRIYRGLIKKVSDETNVLFGNKYSNEMNLVYESYEEEQ